MQDELELLLEEQVQNTKAVDDGERKFEDDLYKKWFKAGSKSGFLSIRSWLDGGKFVIDIGETGDGGLKGSTACFVNAVEIATYIKAVYDGHGTDLYPAKKSTGAPSPEAFVYYGGGKDKNYNGKAVSRVLKIHHWQTGVGDNASYDANSFVWKCGHFDARVSATGAVIPDMKSPLSVNSIKVTRQEMAQINLRMQLALQVYANKEDDFFRALNGNKR